MNAVSIRILAAAIAAAACLLSGGFPPAMLYGEVTGPSAASGQEEIHEGANPRRPEDAPPLGGNCPCETSPGAGFAPLAAKDPLARLVADKLSAPSRNIFGADARVPLTTDKFPWKTIGKIAGCNCTGTLVGRDLVLTAAHCVVDPASRKISGNMTYFRPNYRAGKYQDEAWITYAWWGTDDPDNHRGRDWAILKLDKPLGNKYGWLGVHLTDMASFPPQVTVAGYSGDFKGGEIAGIHHNCHTRGRYVRDNLILHDGATSRGCSGGPMLRMYDNRLMIVGLNVAEFRRDGEVSLRVSFYADQYANIAIPSKEFLVQLRALLK